MQQDGWWLNPPPVADRQSATRAAYWRLGLLAALIAAGDVLMWQTVPGLSLAVFAGLCVAAAILVWPSKVSGRTLCSSAGVAVLSVLPVVELVQPLSVMILAAGLPVSLAMLAGRLRRGSARFWWAAPLFTCRDMLDGLHNSAVVSAPTAPSGGRFKALAMGWALPLGVGLVFAALLLSANPVLDDALRTLPIWEPDLPAPSRVLLWLGLGVLVWPILSLARFAPVLAPDDAPLMQGPTRLPAFVNAPAIMRSLVLFNLMFSVQNGVDMLVLTGGAGLPEGMTFAQYAHRGAYPLIVLALLSGGFAILARPFITAAPVLRALLLIWVAQTIWLTFSSMLRLDLYVEVYGLTRLRLAAAIWMGVVLGGLGLTLWQIGRGLSNLWLLRRVAILGCVVLYFCSFLGFDATIARYNLARDVPRDPAYLCHLSEAAAPVIARYDPTLCAVLPQVSHPSDWREWGFRNARTRHRVKLLATGAAAQ